MGEPEDPPFGANFPRLSDREGWDRLAQQNRDNARVLLSGYTLGTSPYALGAIRALVEGRPYREGVREEREAMKRVPDPARAVGEFAGGWKAPLSLLGRARPFQRILPATAEIGGQVKRVGRAVRPFERMLAPLRGGAAAGAISGAAAAEEEGEDPVTGGLIGGTLGAIPGMARGAGRVGRRMATGAVRAGLNLLERGASRASPSLSRGMEAAQRGLGVIAGRVAGEHTTSEKPVGRDVTPQADTERLARRWVNEALMNQSPQELLKKLDAMPTDQDSPIMQAVRRRIAEYE